MSGSGPIVLANLVITLPENFFPGLPLFWRLFLIIPLGAWFTDVVRGLIGRIR